MATIKQKLAIDELAENGGNVSKAMRDAGYSEETAKTPQKLTESKGFKEIFDKAISDELLSQKHKELLEQKQLAYFVFSKKMEDEEIVSHMAANDLTVIVIRESDKGKLAFYSTDDPVAKKNALDMAYKLKGSYAAEKKDITTMGEKLPSTDLDALAAAMALTLKEQKT